MPIDIATNLRWTKKGFEAGLPGYVDFLCREILEQDPDNADALNILGVVAAGVGLRDQSIAFFEAALASDPRMATASDNLRRLAAMPAWSEARRTIDGDSFLLIKAWGFGFWADVSHVLGGLLLADLTGRIPIVHWGGNSLFCDGSGRDAFTLYFEPVSPLSLDRLPAAARADVFPAKWSRIDLGLDDQAKWNGQGSRLAAIEYLTRPETLAVTDFHIGLADLVPWIPRSHRLYGKSTLEVLRDVISRRLRPRSAILAAAAAFHQRHLSDGPSLAVHVRGTDKVAEMPEVDRVNERYFDQVDARGAADRIFLLTDDARWAAAFKSRYGDRVVLTAAQRAAGEIGVHRIPTADRTRLGREVMLDTYVATLCDRFLGYGRSNVSAMVHALKPWGLDACVLLEPSQLLSRIYVSLPG